MTAAALQTQKGKEAQPDQDTFDIVWESLSDAVGRNDGLARGTDTARYLIEALAERGMCVAPITALRDVAEYLEEVVADTNEGCDWPHVEGSWCSSFCEQHGCAKARSTQCRAALKTPRE